MESEIRHTIAESLSSFRLPRYDDIPNVGLYLEQTVNYLMEYLSLILDSAVTTSMVSNYVKKKLVKNPVKKQYNREQIAVLFFIAITKSVLSLENIRVLLTIREDHFDSAAAYNLFCEELEMVLMSTCGLDKVPESVSGLSYLGSSEFMSDPFAGQPLNRSDGEFSGTEEREILHNVVVMAANKIYLDKWISLFAGKK